MRCCFGRLEEMRLLGRLVVRVRRCTETGRQLWYPPSYEYCRFGDPLDELRNRRRQYSCVVKSCVSLGINVWIVLFMVSDRYISRLPQVIQFNMHVTMRQVYLRAVLCRDHSKDLLYRTDGVLNEGEVNVMSRSVFRREYGRDWFSSKSLWRSCTVHGCRIVDRPVCLQRGRWFQCILHIIPLLKKRVLTDDRINDTIRACGMRYYRIFGKCTRAKSGFGLWCWYGVIQNRPMQITVFTHARHIQCVNGEDRTRAYGRCADVSILFLSIRRKRIGKRVVAGGNVKGSSYVLQRMGKGGLWVVASRVSVGTLYLIEKTVLETEVLIRSRMLCAGWQQEDSNSGDYSSLQIWNEYLPSQ